MPRMVKGDEPGAPVTFSMETVAEMSEIKAKAEKAGMFMKAPNGKASKLTERQWLLVRTKAFKAWFGDWEKVALFKSARDEIMSMPAVAKLSGMELQKDGVPLTDKVPAYWNDVYHGAVESPEIGRVILDREGVKSSMGHGIGSLKSAAFYAVPDVIRFGRVFDRQTNWKERGYDTAVIAAPIYIGDTEYICEVVVERRPNKQSFYVHEVEIKEKLSNVFKTSTEGGTRQASRSVLAQRANEVNTLLECLEVDNKLGNKTPVVCAVEHKKGRDGNRYLVSAYPLEDRKLGKITQQLDKLVYCRYNDTAKFAADAPKGKAFDLLRAAIDGGRTVNVADYADIVKWKKAINTTFSASMEEASLKALNVLRTRADEGERNDNQLYHPCLYWDKAKARIWTGGGGLQSPTAPYPKRASGRSIQTPANLVKYKEEKI